MATISNLLLPTLSGPENYVIVLLLMAILGPSCFWLAGIGRWRRMKNSGAGRLSQVSVIIVGRDEELYIRTAIESVLACDYPSEKLEVCFVDDHSTDSTFEIAKEVSRSHAGRLQVLRAPDVQAGVSPKKSALEYAIGQTHGDILLFTDADSRVQRGWIQAMLGEYDEHTGAVAGATLPVSQGTTHGALFRLERFLVALTSAAAVGFGSPASVSGQNFSFRRRTYEDVGGYAFPHVASGDDDLMIQKIANHGWHVKFCSHPRSLVTDIRPPDLPSHAASAARHQSTIRFYPLHWRVAYLLSILSGWMLICALVGALFRTVYLPVVALIFGAKVLVDGLGAYTFARRLEIKLRLYEILLTELLLPLYLVIRPLFALMPGFTWRGRSHSRPQNPIAESVS